MSKPIILYGHKQSFRIFPLRTLLDRSQISYTYIDIHHDKEARRIVQQINNTQKEINTIVFHDDSTLSDPSINELRDKLESIGYEVPQFAWLLAQAHRYQLLIGAVVILLMIISNISEIAKLL